MVSQTLSVYASSDGRRYTRSYHAPYTYMPDRRFQLHPHDNRVMTMTDSEVESDPSQQRKRISVAVSTAGLVFHSELLLQCVEVVPKGGGHLSNCFVVRKMS